MLISALHQQGKNFSGADLSGVDLSEANLQGANLSGVNLYGANLYGAKLHEFEFKNSGFFGRDLSGANLSEANLSGVNLTAVKLDGVNLYSANLSGCVIDESTLLSKRIFGCEKGVNGIYCPITDSAALMELRPRGNSMQGSDANAIIESIKHARRLHNITLLFSVIVLVVVVLKPEKIKLPWFSEVTYNPTQLAALAVLLSTGIMILIESSMRSALQGAQYIKDRDSAMKVGHFPCTLSKYENGSLLFFMRLLISLFPIAPVIYMFFKNPPTFLFFDKAEIMTHWGYILIASISFILLFFCIKTFLLSQQFQKPILFDPATEKKRKNDATILNEKVSELNAKVSELVELLKTK